MSPSNLAIQLSLPLEWQQAHLEELIDSGQILPIPQSVMDRDGKRMDTSSERWVFNLGPSTSSCTWKIESPLLRHSVMSFAINRIMRISSTAGRQVARDIPSMLSYSPAYSRLSSAPDISVYREILAQVMIEVADVLKRNQTYWRYWILSAWYKWGATRHADLGFDASFGQRLEAMRIPGGPKGAAVRSEDPLLGPLDHELERPLLELALATDKSNKRDHLQQQLAVALSLAFGRNPLSLRLLTEEDFRTTIDKTGKGVHTLNIPLIKKRKPWRSDFLSVEIGPMLADLIKRVIEANNHIESSVYVKNTDGSNEFIQMHRSLFMTKHPRPTIIASSDRAYALSIAGGEFCSLLRNFIRRHEIVSPITSELLHITPRRMRYTFATDMVDMGLSRAELALALGHHDTQSVRVYFDIGSRIVPHLEKAAAGRIEPILDMFLPSEISCTVRTTSSAGVSQRRLTAPVSCFLCPAFRPSNEVDHARLLEALRNELDGQASATSDSVSNLRRVVSTLDNLISTATKGSEADE